MKTKKLPINKNGEIVVTFTEDDLKNADEFTPNYGCLQATALKRVGFKHVFVGGWDADIDGKNYLIDRERSLRVVNYSLDMGSSGKGPRYAKTVVGKKVYLVPNPY